MNSNERVVLIGLENSDGSLSGSLSVIETLAGLDVKAAGDNRERGVLSRSMSNSGTTVGAKNYDVTLPVELKGSGMEVDGVTVKAPPMHAALIASGMFATAGRMVQISNITGTFACGEMITNGTAGNKLGTILHVVKNDSSTQTLWIRLENLPADGDALAGDTSAATATVDSSSDAILYQLSTADTNTCQLHVWRSNTRRIVRRAIGSWQFDFKAGESASMQFTLKGLYSTPTDEALPDAEYSDTMPPIGENAGLIIEGYPDEGTIEHFALQQGNQLAPVPDINSSDGRRAFKIQSRKPVGSIDPEAVELGRFNPFTLWESGTKAPIHCTLGSQPGERISVVVTAAQFNVPGDKSRAGNDAYELSYTATGTDDDEIFLFFH